MKGKLDSSLAMYVDCSGSKAHKILIQDDHVVQKNMSESKKRSRNFLVNLGQFSL